MYSLVIDICNDSTIDPLLNLVGVVVRVIWYGIPLALIILGSIDLGKAVINSKEDEVKKAKKSFINRLIYAVAVFAVVWLVTVIMNLIAGFGFTSPDSGTVDTTGWKACWSKIIS